MCFGRSDHLMWPVMFLIHLMSFHFLSLYGFVWLISEFTGMLVSVLRCARCCLHNWTLKGSYLKQKRAVVFAVIRIEYLVHFFCLHHVANWLDVMNIIKWVHSWLLWDPEFCLEFKVLVYLSVGICQRIKIAFSVVSFWYWLSSYNFYSRNSVHWQTVNQ